MVDNVAITAGVGTTIATDDAGAGGHVQIIKLAVSTDGSATLIPAEATNGLDVDVTRVQGVVAVGDGTNAISVMTAAADAISNTENRMRVVAALSLFNGTTWDRARGDIANGLDVDVTRIGGNVAITHAALNVGANSGAKVEGSAAHDAVDAGNPLKIGSKAATALPTAVAANDIANAISDLFGRQLIAHISPEMALSKSANYTTTQTGAAIWTPATGKKVAITSLILGSYATTAGRVIIWFGAAADTTYTAGTDQLVAAVSFAPGTGSKPGLSFTPAVPIFAATADHVLRITTDAAISIDVAAHGYEF